MGDASWSFDFKREFSHTWSGHLKRETQTSVAWFLLVFFFFLFLTLPFAYSKPLIQEWPTFPHSNQMHFWTLIFALTCDSAGNAMHLKLASVSFPGWITKDMVTKIYFIYAAWLLASAVVSAEFSIFWQIIHVEMIFQKYKKKFRVHFSLSKTWVPSRFSLLWI